MMKVAFYNTGGVDARSPYTPRHYLFPKRSTEWDELAEYGREHEIFVYDCMGGTHLIDTEMDQIAVAPENVTYKILPDDAGIEEIADRIAGDGIQVAIAFSMPDVFHDWNPVRDALVGQALRKRGVRVISHKPDIAQLCLEKGSFARFMKEHGFSVANSVYVHGGLFYADRRIPVISNNIYQEYIRSRIADMNYPVIIKVATGGGSVGLLKAEDPDDAMRKLRERQDPTDVMVEELLTGENFGIEIYGDPEGYHVTDPVQFTVCSEGITDPFTSLKFGPITPADFPVEELKDEVKRLAGLLGLEGAAELDVIFSRGKWYILEVNPRFSLLSQVVALIEDRNIFRLLLDTVKTPKDRFSGLGEQKYALDFKSAFLPFDRIREAMEAFPVLKHALDFEDRIADDTDVRYCEWVVQCPDKNMLKEQMIRIRERFPDIVSENVIRGVKRLIEDKTGF